MALITRKTSLFDKNTNENENKIQKVFITGGSGFLGSTLIQTLYQQENIKLIKVIVRSNQAKQKIITQLHKITANKEENVEDTKIQFINCDLDNVDMLVEGMKGCDIVIHCAALTDLTKPWNDFYLSNVIGTKNILEAAIQANISKVIHISSEAAFVTGLGSPLQNINETTPLPDPNEQIHLFYPRSKNMAERICQEYHNRCNIIILRPRFIWGYGDTVVLPELIAASKSFLGFSWIGGGNYLTSICNISNIVHAILLATLHNGPSGEAYFISDNEIITQKEFMSQLFHTQGIDSSSFGDLSLFLAQWIAYLGLIPQISPTSLSLMAQEITVSHEKAKNELGYEPIINLEEGLKELHQEYLEQLERI